MTAGKHISHATSFKAIDAHQHFWLYNAAEHAWINGEMKKIRRDFLPGDLQPLLSENDVEGCVAVQASQTENETGFLIALAAENDFIKGVVGWVDLRAENLCERLQYYQSQKVVKGFRHILQGEEPGYMLMPDFVKGISMLHEFGFTYDILVYPKHLEAALQLVTKFPRQRFVIDHIAKPDIRRQRVDNWEKGIRAMAQHPNVYCKISGMVTEADWHTWEAADLHPYLNVVTEAFGVNRLMYGSDWPVCLVAASYQQMIAPVRAYYATFSTAEQEKIFRANAVSFYHL